MNPSLGNARLGAMRLAAVPSTPGIVTVSASARIGAGSSARAPRIWTVTAASGLGIHGAAASYINLMRSAASPLRISSSASVPTPITVSASAGLGVSSSVSAPRTFRVSATSPLSTSATAIVPAIPHDSTTFSLYAIRPAPGERKLLYFSEPGLPEAWPPWNAVALPEDGDEVTGLMVKGSFLYILERRHIYRLTFQGDPAQDGFVFLSTQRGCLNNRCWVQVEDSAYMLDEVGIHSFDGGQQSTPISTPIQNLFQQDGTSTNLQVDWTADQTLWHAAHDPVRDTIRWFVTMVGTEAPYHAICHDYRQKRWWIERYPTAITASATGTIGYRRSLVGTEARKILCLSEGALDGAQDAGTLRGTATSATDTTLVDSAATFNNNLAGVPVSIVAGTGRGQQRLVAENSGVAMTVVQPWDPIPDRTSVYQVGGVEWSWRSGWFEYVDDESSNPRDIELVFQPTKRPASLDCQLYHDHKDEPRAWGYSQDQDGVATRNGEPHIAVNLQDRDINPGYAIQRMSGHAEQYSYGDKFVSIAMSGVQGPDPVRIYQVTVGGAVSVSGG